MPKKLSALAEKLEDAGYFRVYQVFGEGNQRDWDWDKVGATMKQPLRALWETFLCGKSIAREKLDRLVGAEMVDRLLHYQVGQVVEGQYRLDKINLITCQRFPLFVERGFPSKSYFGEDSQALMSMAPPSREGATLCLNAGGGFEAFPQSCHNGAEFVFESDRGSRHFLQANLELNGLLERSRFVTRQQKHKPKAYELILSRVPSMIEPGGVKLPPLVAGGEDGLREFERTLDLSATSLTDQGSLRFLLLAYGGENSKRVGQQIQQAAQKRGLESDLTLLTRLNMEPGVPVFNQTFTYAEVASKKPSGEILLEKLINHFKDSGLTHCYLVKGVCRRQLKKRARHNLVDLTANFYGSWTM